MSPAHGSHFDADLARESRSATACTFSTTLGHLIKDGQADSDTPAIVSDSSLSDLLAAQSQLLRKPARLCHHIIHKCPRAAEFGARKPN